MDIIETRPLETTVSHRNYRKPRIWKCIWKWKNVDKLTIVNDKLTIVNVSSPGSHNMF